MHTSLLFLWAVLVIIFGGNRFRSFNYIPCGVVTMYFSRAGSVAFRLSGAQPTSSLAPAFKYKRRSTFSARISPREHASSRTSLSATHLSATNFESISKDVTVVASNTHSMNAEEFVQPGDKLSTSVTYGPHIKWKGAVLNMWGIGYALSLLLTSTLLLPLLFVLTAMSDLVGDTKVYQACVMCMLSYLLLFSSH